MGKRSHAASTQNSSSPAQTTTATMAKTNLVQTKSRRQSSDATCGKRPKIVSSHVVANENDVVAADAAAAAETTRGAEGNAEPATAKRTQQLGAATAATSANICAACQRPIRERYLLVALDKHWHEDCLKCACCECRLGEVGSSLFTHSGKILCRRDFLRIFGQHGNCAACKRSIPPYELVMRANENAYHMDCFACQLCRYRFCVGDRFHLTDAHRIVCVVCFSDAHTSFAQPAPAAASEAGEPDAALISVAPLPASQRDGDDELEEQVAAPGPVAPAPAAGAAEQQTACAV